MTDFLQYRRPYDALSGPWGMPKGMPSRTSARLAEAKRYPWWKSALTTVPNNSPAFFQWQWVGPGGAPAFQNDRKNPIKIDEVRFLCYLPMYPTPPGNFLAQVMVMLHTDNRQDIVAKWLNATALQTQIDQFTTGGNMSGLFRLPAPYFIGSSHAFRMEFTSLAGPIAYERLEVTLHGRDPVSDSPIVLDKQEITLPPVGGRVATAFDEERDNSLRDAWLDHITFSITSHAGMWPDLTPLRDVAIKFYPPSGVNWSFDTWTPLEMLLEHMMVHDSAATDGLYSPPVIHKPVMPYILNPGDSMTIKGMTTFAAPQVNIPIYALVRGTQEAEQ